MRSRGEIRSLVESCIARSACDDTIIRILYNEGDFFFHEDALWDFKEKVGIEDLPPASDEYKYKICDICKDIAAFYNSSGGYIVFGVNDDDKKIVGVNCSIPVDSIENRIKSDLSAQIDFTVFNQSIGDNIIPIIFIPPRSDDVNPIDFKRDSKKNQRGKHCYKKGDIYHREGDASVPATSSALIELISRTRIGDVNTLTDHNLPARDKTFTRFIGRRGELDTLWRWFLDPFNNTRLVAGIGGVGKTTLVREFVEEVLSSSPLSIEKIVWLSAKKTNFDAEFNKRYQTSSRDPNLFSDEFGLYSKILTELGYLENDVKDSWNEVDFIAHLEKALSITSTLLVVDDLDSLDDESQRSIFSNLSGVFRGLSARSRRPGRCIMTARLRLGASRSQYHELKGFPEKEFFEFIRQQYNLFELQVDFSPNSKLFRKFYQFAHGSPLFATSIVRLVRHGLALDQALNRWEGAEGEEVREFAFKREIDTLSSSQLRALYAIINLSPCSFIEIKSVTDATEAALMSDLGTLADFHLVSRDSGVRSGGREFTLPSNSGVLKLLVREKMSDPNRIERKCREIRKEKARNDEYVSSVIGRVVAFWRDEKFEEALNIIDYEYKKAQPENFHKDLECMYGRALLRVGEPKLNAADAAFQRAYDKGCQRPELMDLWIETRQLKKDWLGVVQVCEHDSKARSNWKRHVDIGQAYVSLAYEQSKGPDLVESISTLLKGGKYLDNVIAKQEAGSYFSEINSLRKECFVEAVRTSVLLYRSDEDIIYVWENAWQAFDCYVRSNYIISTALEAADRWVNHIRRHRQRYSDGDFAKLNEIIGKLSEMVIIFEEKNWSDQIIRNRTELILKDIMSFRDHLII